MTDESPTNSLPPGLGDRPWYLLAITQGGLRGIGEPALEKELGIGVKQYGVMSVLAGLEEPPSQQALGELMRVDRTTMVQTVDALEERGFVSREPNPRDRRERLLRLTPDGRKALRRAEKIVERFEDEFFEPLSGDERAEFIRILKVLAARHGRAPRPH